MASRNPLPQRNHHESFMAVALNEARRGLGHTSPNPAVGAVLVVNGEIVASGYHRRAGAPHAEVECLRAFRARSMADATLYVTLEPCSTIGRTGSCTAAIIDAGIKRVVVGAQDSNPLHNGSGFESLREAGIDVTVGILETECQTLTEAYNKWIRTKRPFVIAKCGMTLDGRLTLPPESGRWITSAASRRRAHRLRAQIDAILVGAETVRVDNPRLTVRGIRGAKQPWRVVLSRSGQLPKTSLVLTDRHADRTLVYRSRSLAETFRELGEKNITSVLIEGGGDILSQALDERLIDKVVIYLAPVFAGGSVVAFGGRGAGSTAEATRIRAAEYEKIGQDVCVSGYTEYPPIAAE